MAENKEKRNWDGTRLGFLMVWVCSANAITLGYDSSMMNGLQILPAYSDYFQLTTATTALNVAIVFVGSVLNIPFAGPLSEKWGRKWGMFASAVIAIAGCIIQSAAQNEAMFCIGRLVVGFSVNMGGVTAPAYLGETANPRHRSALVGMYGAMMNFGNLLAAGVTFGSQYVAGTWAWRLPSLLQLVPQLLILAPLPFLPESPRWLIYHDRAEEAREIIVKYHGGGDPTSPVAVLEYEEIVATLAFEKTQEKPTYRGLLATKGNRWRMGIILILSFICMWSGNAIVTYYLGQILTTAGITSVTSQLGINVGLTAMSVCAAVVGSLTMKHIPRRKGFLISLSGCAGILIVQSILTKLYYGSDNVAASSAVVFLVFLFTTVNTCFMSPGVYVYAVEILSYSTRANGLSIYNGVCYALFIFILFVIPYAMRIAWGFYLINGIWCLAEVAMVFVWFPETKGLNLEEVNTVIDGPEILNAAEIKGKDLETVEDVKA